ncbi:MAG: glutamine--fructose-6-phosphate transaminase (isomerizing) [Oscillospiraceae bacterium]|jgi:glucosamine--fructose-6-phosphate aminotransferase (isomerizing)|nr:glutamine--fructose-6-phosphate transaminase (isomerizing) [Oscillospiraceae bacterium]
MCGIIGYAGTEEACPILLDGLERLEYRGYDSTGLALFTKDGGLLRLRAAGRLSALRRCVTQRLEQGADLHGNAGLGHTRWATHGAPTKENAHPHRSQEGKYTVVHNGIIENYAKLRGELEAAGIRFASQTDTEVIAHLLEQLDTGNPLETLRRALPRLEGSYALGVLYHAQPGTLYCARRQSPLLAASCVRGVLLASDAAAILPFTRTMFRLEDGEMAQLHANGAIFFFDAQGRALQKAATEIARHTTAADKGGYVHFMRKEIAEQPECLARTLAPLLSGGEIHLGESEAALENPGGIRRVLFLGCGSAHHAGITGRMLVEELSGIPASAELASEFRSAATAVDRHTLAVIISQSGETADSLQALRLAKEKGARTLSVINVEGSSIAAESGSVLYTRAGLEVAVATTKAYSAQLAALCALAARLGALRGQDPARLRDFVRSLAALPELAREVLADTEATAHAWAQELQSVQHAYFLGRNLDYATAMESALKLKEISYIHAEAYAAGELKHGTLSLIEPGTPVVALCCRPEVIPKTLGNAQEALARGAKLFCVTNRQNPLPERCLTLPPCHPLLVASLAVLPMQLLAYHCADLRGCDVDKPRSLAKSVTVE